MARPRKAMAPPADANAPTYVTVEDDTAMVDAPVLDEVWRYADMCRHWGVSRTTIERWVRRYEQAGSGIPVHRDPSGRPYWLPHEASGAASQRRSAGPAAATVGGRLDELRRASRRRHRPTSG